MRLYGIVGLVAGYYGIYDFRLIFLIIIIIIVKCAIVD